MDIIQSFPILHHSVDTSNVMYSFLLRQNNKYKSIMFPCFFSSTYFLQSFS